MFPLGGVLLPGELLPLRIFEPRYRALLDDCLTAAAVTPDATPGFGVVLIARGHEVGGGDVRHDVGTIARVDQLHRERDGRAALVCTGSRRFQVVEWLPDDPYPRARIAHLDEPTISATDRPRLVELGGRIVEVVDRIRSAHLDRDSADDLGSRSSEAEMFDPSALGPHGVLGWAARLPIGPADRQQLLVATTVAEQIALLDDALDGIEAVLRFRG
ncbi:LON peptidase substrate-binding domain-containing protein [Gordonia soli]|uniref:Peptidase S16 family protein n=1 Tax=Gordonia soli NBRC 108243 TaxID=1223545 RepID=M0QHN1_9ACTN|nr:LON peptidase substrate-binding domain-containing protein [Gordonia soli]GAC68063.1 peptidase S16 family protein [Gordonia soli NBRC 108243]